MSDSLKIVKFGHPILRKQAKEITDFKSVKTKMLISNLIETVNLSNGLGLAAPQINESKQIIVMSSRPNKRYPNAPLMEELVLINPKLMWFSEEQEKDWEGCLSLPGIRGNVPRSTKVKVEYISEEGNKMETEFEGFLAELVVQSITTGNLNMEA